MAHRRVAPGAGRDEADSDAPGVYPKKALEETQKRAEELLDVQRSRIYWAEELIKYQNFDTVTKDLVDRFIDKVIVESSKEITVVFWFGDTFEELSGIKGELSYAV